ncbi:MAG: D-2-hydroxyacid dehydrogenase [Acidobacteria bacterium]|nr:D-2-hydroxyacid dehydrogenase [Acidobacteriota bacterium]
MQQRSRCKLLWPSSSRIQYGHVPDWVEQALKDRFPQLEVIVAREEATLSRELEDCEILVSWKVSSDQLARCRKLRWIHSPAAGVRQLLVPELMESDIVVTNARTVHALPVAEHAVALLFALARRFPDSFRYQAERRWGQAESWQPGRLPTELNGKTLVLIGFGSIGREVAVRAKALGMRVVAVKRDPSHGAECADQVYGTQQLLAALPQADYLIVTAPDTPETHCLIGERELRCLKPTACLINVSRGSLVDTEALTRALESGRLAGAALDVTDPEPLPPEHPLWTLPNVLLTPHLGGATDRYWERQLELLQENLRRYLAGEPLQNVVDKKRGY